MPTTQAESKTRRSAALASLKDVENNIAAIHAHAKSIGRTEPIGVYHPLNASHDRNQKMSDILDAARGLAGVGVGWASWMGTSETLAQMRDDVKRFGDEVASKLP